MCCQTDTQNSHTHTPPQPHSHKKTHRHTHQTPRTPPVCEYLNQRPYFELILPNRGHTHTPEINRHTVDPTQPHPTLTILNTYVISLVIEIRLYLVICCSTL